MCRLYLFSLRCGGDSLLRDLRGYDHDRSDLALAARRAQTEAAATKEGDIEREVAERLENINRLMLQRSKSDPLTSAASFQQPDLFKYAACRTISRVFTATLVTIRNRANVNVVSMALPRQAASPRPFTPPVLPVEPKKPAAAVGTGVVHSAAGNTQQSQSPQQQPQQQEQPPVDPAPAASKASQPPAQQKSNNAGGQAKPAKSLANAAAGSVAPTAPTAASQPLPQQPASAAAAPAKKKGLQQAKKPSFTKANSNSNEAAANSGAGNGDSPVANSIKPSGSQPNALNLAVTGKATGNAQRNGSGRVKSPSKVASRIAAARGASGSATRARSGSKFGASVAAPPATTPDAHTRNNSASLALVDPSSLASLAVTGTPLQSAAAVKSAAAPNSLVSASASSSAAANSPPLDAHVHERNTPSPAHSIPSVGPSRPATSDTAAASAMALRRESPDIPLAIASSPGSAEPSRPGTAVSIKSEIEAEINGQSQSQSAHAHQLEAGGVVDKDNISLMYDPILRCYFNPQTSQYYELKTPFEP